MAQLVFSAVGTAVGSMFGMPQLGGLIGGVAGSMLSNAIGGGGGKSVSGPRLKDLDVLSSTEGAPIPRLYGRMRVSGQIIWATKLEEVISEREEGGGKGGASQSDSGANYSYFANFAIGLCEGETAYIARVWADNKPLDMSKLTTRFYRGTETQEADPLIVAKMGVAETPAYRGLSYIVFERMPLDNYGGRIPQLTFELVRPCGSLETKVKAVVMIPGSTEFGYSPNVLLRKMGLTATAPETRHSFMAGSDFTQSLEELVTLCPNLERIALVVSWFGTDLRAGSCLIEPGVEILDKAVIGATWKAGGVTRGAAHYISRHEGLSSYGGTPDDQSVIDAIRAIKAKGIKVMLYPFMMMDIPVNNALPHPRWAGSLQPAYPWRGTITTSTDLGATVTSEIAAFMGSATAANFTNNGDYTGAADWGFKRHIHHYARLAVRAGGVDAFVIGSEMIGLSRMRSASGIYPFVDALVALAGEIKAVLPTTLLTYAADWTEYGSHVLDGASEVRFPLDKLWASNAIGAVGIDYYAPLTDWRDGDHLDQEYERPHNKDYIKDNIFGGEAYDFYYGSSTDRAAQNRLSITDGAFNKPWIYRQKDLKNWWGQPHVERLGGVEISASPWIAQSKPLWLTEFGVPAIDKGTNQPSVFPDPKSSTASTPYFSNGRRDDGMQRAGIEAFLEFFDTEFGGEAVNNPVSSVYNAPMLDPSALHLWAWDARPYPIFPLASSVWSDGPNWQTGHWLNGRLGSAPLSGIVEKIASDYEIANIDASCLTETVDGYLLDRVMSMRDGVEALARVFQFNPIEKGDKLEFCGRHTEVIVNLNEHDLVETKEPALVKITRAQSSELPSEVSLAFNETFLDFRVTAASSRRLTTGSGRNARSEIAVAANRDVMEDQADFLLHDIWAGAETFEFILPLSSIKLTVGDVISLNKASKTFRLKIASIEDGFERKVQAKVLGPLRGGAVGNSAMPSIAVPTFAGPAHYEVIEIPHINKDQTEILSYLAVTASPWQGGYVLSKSTTGTSFTFVQNISVPSIFGEVLTELTQHVPWIWDRVQTLDVKITSGTLSSLPEDRVFEGENMIAVKNANGNYELIQFQNAELIAPMTYRLSMLLRGQTGTEAMMATINAGASLVLLDKHITKLNEGVENYNRELTYRLVPYGAIAGGDETVTFTHAANKIALMPLKPVHLKARRVASGIEISFIRRTRIDGDSWEIAEVPLSETSEAYRLEIMSGAVIKRVLNLTSTSTLYTDELTDFGVSQTSLTMRVVQISAIVGDGFVSEKTVGVMT